MTFQEYLVLSNIALVSKTAPVLVTSEFIGNPCNTIIFDPVPIANDLMDSGYLSRIRYSPTGNLFKLTLAGQKAIWGYHHAT